MNDDRDLHDAALDALLRTHSAETPPPAVDAAVLAAAHRAVDGEMRARPARATQPWRWWMPLAAAAAIGVVVIGILPLAPTLVEPTPPVTSDAPTTPAAPPPSATQPIEAARPDAQGTPMARVPVPSATDRMSAKRGAAATREREATVANDSAPSRPYMEMYRYVPPEPPAAEQDRRANATGAVAAMPQAAPAPKAFRPQQEAAAPAPATQVPQEANAQPPRQGSAAALTQPARSPEVLPRTDAMSLEDRQKVAAAQPRTVDEWFALIRKLRSENRVPDAIRALADFRAAFSDADARLPEDLRDWAKTVP